jgi:bifunctional DNA-binding transcriptional regulator/antitoxin component of YhaV-PrlF toxin-antitoxin module
MYILSITQTGLITLSEECLHALGAKPGDKLEARVEKRKLVLRRIQSLNELQGSVKANKT